jgi:ABC-type nitrate/sulfonate/bicarbonate transport system permease component
MFAYIFTMMVIAVLFTEGIRWAERSAFPWRVGM